MGIITVPPIHITTPHNPLPLNVGVGDVLSMSYRVELTIHYFLFVSYDARYEQNLISVASDPASLLRQRTNQAAPSR